MASVNSRHKNVLLRETKAVLYVYESKGFYITSVHADKGFICVREEIRPMELNIYPTEDHVYDVDRSICTVKKWVWSTIHRLPFTKISRIINTNVVVKVVKYLNQFPTKDGISETMSTLSMMTGRPRPNYDNLLLEFVTYLQAFEDNDPTNTTKARTTPNIALNHTDNAQEGYFCMSLATGFKLDRQ